MKKKKNQEAYAALCEKSRKLENIYFSTKEKLKIYGYKDSSENADWSALNEKLAIYWSQINLLKVKLAKMSQEDDKIITYRLLETSEEKTIQLTNGEIDPDQGKISAASPLGIALNNKKVGEISEVKTNYKSYKVKIININKR